MDIKEELLREHTRSQAQKIASWIGTDPGRVREFVTLYLAGEYRVTQRAAWVMGIIGETHPDVLAPFLKKMIAKVKEPGVHNAVRRNTLRILQTIDIPRGLLGTVVDLCFDALASPKETIAVKVYAMTVIVRIAKKEPDLEKELRLVVGQQLPGAGPAFRARARHVLKMTNSEEPA